MSRMVNSIGVSIRAYRAAAAKRFAVFVSSRTANHNKSLTDSEVSAQNAPYQRAKIPGLEDYIQNSADAHRAHIEAKMRTKQRGTCIARALGHGEPVDHLHITIRKERWLRIRAERNHYVRVPHRVRMTSLVAPCGIPKDVLQQAAAQFLLHKKSCQAMPAKPKSLGAVLGRRMVDECIGPLDIRDDPSFSVHIKRCEDILATGRNAITLRRKKTHATSDNFEYVRRKYAGRPDELYRRKTARKYATWRRKRQEENRMLHERELKAEREMKKRRGHDRLLTSRPTGDSSFAPFLYELSNNTYAYSSKITEAPKLRKIMIDKYTESTIENNPEPDQLRKALQIAETNPLFHTRVMNRFS